MTNKDKVNRIYAILGDVKRGAITIELGVYNIQDIISLALESHTQEVLEKLRFEVEALRGTPSDTERADTEADARAKMLIYLIKNKLL